MSGRAWHREDKRLLMFVRNVGARYAGIVLSAVLGLIVLPYNLHYLGKSAYGLWVLVASITAYFSVLELGYGSATVKYVAEYRAQRDARALNEIVSTTFFLFTGLGLGCYALALMVSFLLPHVFNLDPGQESTGRAVLLILAANVALHFAFSVFGGVVNGFERSYRNAAFSLSSHVLAAAANIVVLRLGYGLVELVAATTAIRMAPYFFYRRNAYHVFPELAIRWSLVSRSRLRELTGFSAYLAIVDWSSRLTYAIDVIILGALLNTGAVAVYSVGQKLAESLLRLTNQLHVVLFPAIVHRSVRASLEAQRALLVRAARFQLAVAVALCGSSVVLADVLIRAWVGPGNEASTGVTQLLAAIVVLRMWMAMPATALKATGHHRFLAASSALCAVASVLLSVVLVNTIGLLGVVWGTFIPVAALGAALVYPRACRALELPIASAYRQIVWPALWPMAPVAMVLAFVSDRLPVRLLWVLPQVALGVALYTVLFLAFGLDREERRWLRTALTSLWGRRAAELAAA